MKPHEEHVGVEPGGTSTLLEQRGQVRVLVIMLTSRSPNKCLY